MCFMLIIMITLWIGTQWNCNNFVLAKGSVRELQQKRHHSPGKLLFPLSLKRDSTVLPELMSSKPANCNITRMFISSFSRACRCWWKYPNYKMNTTTHYNLIFYVCKDGGTKQCPSFPADTNTGERGQQQTDLGNKREVPQGESFSVSLLVQTHSHS